MTCKISSAGSCFNETAQGKALGFCCKIPTMGNFTATNQPHIPPGLTTSPQAVTACPAASEECSIEEFAKQDNALYPRSEGRGFTANWINLYICFR
jgi:hypothetical protein